MIPPGLQSVDKAIKDRDVPKENWILLMPKLTNALLSMHKQGISHFSVNPKSFCVVNAEKPPIGLKSAKRWIGDIFLSNFGNASDVKVYTFPKGEEPNEDLYRSPGMSPPVADRMSKKLMTFIELATYQTGESMENDKWGLGWFAFDLLMNIDKEDAGTRRKWMGYQLQT